LDLTSAPGIATKTARFPISENTNPAASKATSPASTRMEVEGKPNLAHPSLIRHSTPAEIDDVAKAWLVYQQGMQLPEGPADNDLSNRFANVVVNGQVVAVLDNSGGAETKISKAERVSLEGSGDLDGPDLAMWRAQKYAQALGGTVEMLRAAKRQNEWSPRVSPPLHDFSRAELDAAILAMQRQIPNSQEVHHKANIVL